MEGALQRGATVCDRCGDGCYYAPEQPKYGPCWGLVRPVDQRMNDDGESYWIHACDGHQRIWFGGGYLAITTITTAS